ncbi:hypothetical protein GCM10020000_00350 [Streptomyces olivoverticillatus]
MAATLGMVAWPVLRHLEVFSDKGEHISFAQGPGPIGVQTGDSRTSMPTGPEADFTIESTLDDGTKIAQTTLHGAKSGFTGQVWVWAPLQYKDPKYAKSGFPVLIALPGGAGYPKNYWMGGNDLKLQPSIATWSEEGKSLPFIVVMPVLNPAPRRPGDLLGRQRHPRPAEDGHLADGGRSPSRQGQLPYAQVA